MCRRQTVGVITNHAEVEGFDAALATVERLGGKIIMPTMDEQSIGLDAVIQDPEGNSIGLWQPVKE